MEGEPKPYSKGAMDDDDHQRQQKVVGICLVVEEAGKESKLAFRYPPSPHGDVKKSKNGDARKSTKNGEQVYKISKNDDSSELQYQDNIFFTLPPNEMAKLFRTKPSLCGQPLTLMVGGTFFCYRSVLLNQSQGNQSDDDTISLHSRQSSYQGTSSSSPGSLEYLVMFTIVVAVLPAEGSSIEINSLRNNKFTEESKIEKFYKSQNTPVIRRIHLSLSRLCAVLEREERRCLYTSRQVSMLLDIGGLTSTSKESKGKQGESELNEADRMELMVTAKPPTAMAFDDSDSSRNLDRRRLVQLHGNLASELRDTYHAFERNDLAIQQSPASLLTGRDGIVYINLHIAVLIEAATKRTEYTKRIDLESKITIRPYHTILFPNVSAAELLRNITSTGSSSSGDFSRRSLEKLLLVCDPEKTLSIMAGDAALPLPAIIELAMSLIRIGACIPVPVITESTRFACQHGAIKMMSSLRLEFAQTFSHVTPLFIVVAALTGGAQASAPSTGAGTPPSNYVTFGDIKRHCLQAFVEITNSGGEEGGESVPSTYRILTDRLVTTLSSDEINPVGDVNDEGEVTFEDIELLLLSMTTWVRSHSIIVELKDYFVAIESSVSHKHNALKLEKRRSESIDLQFKSDEDFEYIYKECLRRNLLDGSISSTALSWRLKCRFKLETLRDFRDWGVRENRLKVVTRIPCDADDRIVEAVEDMDK